MGRAEAHHVERHGALAVAPRADLGPLAERAGGGQEARPEAEAIPTRIVHEVTMAGGPHVGPRPRPPRLLRDRPDRLEQRRRLGDEEQRQMEAPVEAHRDRARRRLELPRELEQRVAPPAAAPAPRDERAGLGDRERVAGEDRERQARGEEAGPLAEAREGDERGRDEDVHERRQVQHVMRARGAAQREHRGREQHARDAERRAPIRGHAAPAAPSAPGTRGAADSGDRERDAQQRHRRRRLVQQLEAAALLHQPVDVRAVERREQRVPALGEVAALAHGPEAREHARHGEQHRQRAEHEARERGGELAPARAHPSGEPRRVDERDAEDDGHDHDDGVRPVVDARPEGEAAEARARESAVLGAPQQQPRAERAAEEAGREGAPLPLRMEEDRRVERDERTGQQGRGQAKEATRREQRREQRRQRRRERREPHGLESRPEQRERGDRELALEGAEVRRHEGREGTAREHDAAHPGRHPACARGPDERARLLREPRLVVVEAGAPPGDREREHQRRQREPAERERERAAATARIGARLARRPAVHRTPP